MTEPCEHFSEIREVRAGANGCVDCMAIGAAWNELRLCLTCGHVACCEDSEHMHALKHFNATGHPMIASFEPGETWGWCYVDRRYFDPMPGPLPKRRSPLAAFLSRLIGAG
ncbi:MAG: UBP-type zinc finger domain-containing protein [Betaproteobacteria bacterium]